MRILKFSRASAKLLTKQIIKEIEERGEVSVKVNKNNEVEITAEDEKGGNEWIAEQVIRAIFYGFESKHAYKLFSDEYFIDTIDLQSAFRRKETNIQRAKSRIIGEGGKARKKLEALSGAHIVVSNTTDNVSIIGKYKELQNAREAVLRLIEGAGHEGVYRFLENKQEKVI